MNQSNDKHKENLKKILCYNMINNNKCNYGNKCLYAHNLNEQKIEPIRHKLYTLIKNANELRDIDLVNDQKLYDSMLQLTHICSLCNKGLCPGGYNCRNGAVNAKHKICYDDLVYGNCKKSYCQSVHLTQRGLIPYTKQKYIEVKNNAVDKKYDCYKKNRIFKKDLDNVKGVLLTETFLKSYFQKNEPALSSESDTEENVRDIIKYLNDDNTDSDDVSIFPV